MPFDRSPPNTKQYRYSTSLLNPPGHTSPNRAPSTASSYGMSSSPSSTPSSRTRRLPPHMQAFRNAASASAPPNGGLSLYPQQQAQPSPQFPQRPSSSSNNNGYTITSWRPPPASSSPNPSSQNDYASSVRTKSSTGFLRRGTKKKPKLLRLTPNPKPGTEVLLQSLLRPRRDSKLMLSSNRSQKRNPSPILQEIKPLLPRLRKSKRIASRFG